MRIILTIVGCLLVAMGTVWILQGMNILLGSFMSGQPRWSINGGIAVLVGLGLIVLVNRPRRR